MTLTALERELVDVLNLIIRDEAQNRAKCPCGAMHAKVGRHRMAFVALAHADAKDKDS